MKKTLTIVALIMIIAMLTLSGVKAVSSSTLADEIFAKLEKYGMTAADKVKIERNLSTVTEEQESAVLAQVNEIVNTMEQSGATTVKELPADLKEAVKANVQAAAKAVDFSVEFDGSNAKVYNAEGKLVETVQVSEDGTLAYTGNSVNTILVIASVAVIALAAVVVAKKSLSKVGA